VTRTPDLSLVDLKASFPVSLNGIFTFALQNKMVSQFHGLKKVSFAPELVALPALRSFKSVFPIIRAAKQETVSKVCNIVINQLALPKETTLTVESKFSELGADSLDTVEIVMALEEEFKITMEEESAESITPVQEAAELIEKLIKKKRARRNCGRVRSVSPLW